jgi:3-phosphoglycerate kinase
LFTVFVFIKWTFPFVCCIQYVVPNLLHTAAKMTVNGLQATVFVSVKTVKITTMKYKSRPMVNEYFTNKHKITIPQDSRANKLDKKRTPSELF